jgi:hypothetical protein
MKLVLVVVVMTRPVVNIMMMMKITRTLSSKAANAVGSMHSNSYL